MIVSSIMRRASFSVMIHPCRIVQLYDRTRDVVSLDEVERVVF